LTRQKATHQEGGTLRYYAIESEFGIDNLRMLKRDMPEPGHGQVLVKIRAASVNYRDILMISGKYSRNLPLPLIPFSDGAGEIVEIGEGVSRWKPGERVAGIFFQEWLGGKINETAARSALGGAIDGVLAEFVVFHEDGLVAVPHHLSFEEAATLPCAAVTAWNALTSGGLTCGQSVLTLGTGGVSTFALQFAKAAGARIIATSSSDEKLERASKMGAGDGINYKTVPDWEKRVAELTGGIGVDLVVEVGGAGTLGKSLRAVRVGGYISLIRVLSGQSGEVNPLPATMKSVRIQGIFVGSREMFEAMSRAVTVHQIRPVIDRVFPFAKVKEALNYMQSGAHFGKVVIAF
jgi:NADPH:quinone reductase-like Zn-dependent oxidoreductase